MSISDSFSRSYLSPFLGIAASTDLPLASSSPDLRTITSMAKFGLLEAAPPALVGTLRSMTVMLVKTAVMSRKTTRTVNTSIIGVRFRTSMISVSMDSFFLHLRLAMIGSYEYWRLVKVEIVLSALTDAISRLFTIWPVVVVKRAWSSSRGIAVIRPKAVQFMASEMLAASRAAFSAGLAVATAAKAVIRPMMVPSSPNRVAILERSAR